MQVNTFGKYTVQMTTDTAKRLLGLAQKMDYSDLEASEVMDLNAVQLQLEAILEEAHNG